MNDVSPATAPLLVRQISLDEAQLLCAAAVGAARERDVAVSVAVVDGGGNLVAFARMDGAEIAGPALAVDKAYTAVANSCATHELTEASAPGGGLYGLHAASGGRFVVFGGGVPLRWQGRIVGGVGVSGAADAADDIACAEAAVARWA
ncbi:GlcG/HbpS family heme-binding protein [Yinghuangia seranimata]|uniref:GlcG/HbpS family heme-binding protein n=1 Tax=Yinghuangia seranimata TaxID=408067 RepID=UPI00248B6886|nr:heme-binding protein [Yinghuangia seranimata]MDI2130007.1 heme-binding protein [Yinghuangia seranimata]